MAVIELARRGLFLAQGVIDTLLRRMHSQRGVSTVPYSLLVALLALVVALLIGAFGAGLKGLLGTLTIRLH